MSKINEPFKLIGHSYQIADTGDYDGYFEITNGKVSIFTKDEEEENLQPVVKVLNDCGSNFYLDDSDKCYISLLELEIKELKVKAAMDLQLPVLFAKWLSISQNLDSIIAWTDNKTGEWKDEKELYDYFIENIYQPEQKQPT